MGNKGQIEAWQIRKLFFVGNKTYISGSTFGEDGQVYREEEEEDQGWEVGQHCGLEARCETGKNSLDPNLAFRNT